MYVCACVIVSVSREKGKQEGGLTAWTWRMYQQDCRQDEEGVEWEGTDGKINAGSVCECGEED